MINKIVIAGGNGFLGSLLTEYFSKKAKTIVLLVREEKPARSNIIFRYWDGETLGDWVKDLEGADVLINLAGKNVNCRYTEKNKKLIYASRLNSTNALGMGIQKCHEAPKLWINSSSATIYKASFDKLMTEDTGETGNDFSMDVCRQWEAAFNQYNYPQTRKILLRTSIVFGKGGGALPPLLNLVNLGLGGRQGDGKQFVSWIHATDFCRAIDWMIMHPHAQGIYNLAAPTPLSNAEFMATLRKVRRRPFGLPMPTWLLEIGAVIIQTQTELILKSRKVYPKRLLDEGFVFEFSALKDALEDLCRSSVRLKRNFILLP